MSTNGAKILYKGYYKGNYKDKIPINIRVIVIVIFICQELLTLLHSLNTFYEMMMTSLTSVCVCVCVCMSVCVCVCMCVYVCVCKDVNRFAKGSVMDSQLQSGVDSISEIY